MTHDNAGMDADRVAGVCAKDADVLHRQVGMLDVELLDRGDDLCFEGVDGWVEGLGG